MNNTEYNDNTDKPIDSIAGNSSFNTKESDNFKCNNEVKDEYEMEEEYDFSEGIQGKFYKPKTCI